MRVISFRKIREYFERETTSEIALKDWFKKTQKADWENFSDMKKTFNSVDSVGKSRFVFNIKGNLFRIVAIVDFVFKKVYIRFV